MTSMTERVVLSLALGFAVAVCAYYCSKIVHPRHSSHLKSPAASRLAAAPRRSLRELQTSGRWVALCGTVFDVGDDPFFNATCSGVYASWVGHDVTYLVLQLGLIPNAADDAEAVVSYLNREWQLDQFQGDNEATGRGYELLKEWFLRLHSRYEVMAQLSDRYVSVEWDKVRATLLPLDSDSRSSGKCPLGFGAKKMLKTVTRKANNAKDLRTITFQGQRYDVTESKLFHPESGKFSHFVGHDITYALAVQSVRVEDLDVVPTRAYTFVEQLLLEKYRNVFVKEFVLVELDEENDSNTNMMNLHQIIDESNLKTDEKCLQKLEKILQSASAEQVNAICARTTMTLLHKAVEKNYLDLVKMLVSAGAEIKARAALYDDETPLEMAHRFHFEDVAAYLENVAISGK